MTPPIATAVLTHAETMMPDVPMPEPADRPDEAVGRRIRRLFREQDWLDRRRHPRGPWLHIPVLRQVILGAHALYCLATAGRQVRARFGKGLCRQALDIFQLARHEGIDGQTYYLLELYRPGGRQRAARSVTRYETKNGLFSVLNRLRPRLGTRRSPIGDKLAFHTHCRAANIATVPVLATIERGALTPMRRQDEVAQPCDLFLKPRIGKGARGTRLLRHIGMAAGVAQYENEDGSRQSLAEIAAGIAESSLVQPRLVNHPSLADLASRSLLAVRVITCLDASNQPVVTHGMLRVLGKLEPGWHDVTEYGAPIHLATGRLGALAGDKLAGALDWYQHHPHTGAPVAGRLLQHWPAIADLARRAHAACSDRVLLGWDIALTPEGPLVIEGNAHPDLAFLQRAHRTPIAQSPLGPLLQHWLGRLDPPAG
jgi:hypothetical protein